MFFFGFGLWFLSNVRFRKSNSENGIILYSKEMVCFFPCIVCIFLIDFFRLNIKNLRISILFFLSPPFFISISFLSFTLSIFLLFSFLLPILLFSYLLFLHTFFISFISFSLISLSWSYQSHHIIIFIFPAKNIIFF
jgi:hypothetical protein